MKHYFLALIVLSTSVLVTFSLTSFAQETLQTTSSESPSEDELVHFGDVIDVDVIGVFEFDWRGTLNPEGFLDGLETFSDPIYGLCRTEGQIAADIVKVYSKTLRNPNIVVRIIDRSNRAVVRLDGGIRTPTRFRLRRPVHLRELLVLAGGLTDTASGDVSIFRPGNLSCRSNGSGKPLSPLDNGSQNIDIKISELLSGKIAANPEILSGDMITVNKAVPVYVMGAVNNPRPVYVRAEITLGRAIATAGGLAKEADGQKVSILRRDGSSTRVIEIDFEKIKRGEIKDEVLKPFDIIDVVAKGGGKRKYPPIASTNESRDRAITNLPLKVVE